MFPSEYQNATLQTIGDEPLEHTAPAPGRAGETDALYEWFRGLPAHERLGRLVRATRDAIARSESAPCGCAEVLGAVVGVIMGSVSEDSLLERRSALGAAKWCLPACGEARETACAVYWLAYLVAELDRGDCVYGTADPWCGLGWYCLWEIGRAHV